MTRLTTMTATLCLAATGALAQQGGTYSPFCEAAFTPGDTNADGMISPEEAVAIAAGAYDKLDANSDGSIDRTELGTCIGDARAAFLPPEASPGSFAELDTDRSGKLEPPEIAAAVDDMWSDVGSNDPAYMADFVNLETSSEAYEQMLRTREDTAAATGAAAGEATATAEGADAELPDPAESEDYFPQTTLGNAEAGDLPTEAAEVAGDPGTADTAGGAEAATADAGPTPAEIAATRGPPDSGDAAALTLEELAQRTGQAFWLLDTDRDEAITEEEYMARAEEISSIVERQVDTLFGSLDADASGDISEEEYRAAAEARTTEATRRAEESGTLDPATGTLTITTYYLLR